MLKESLIELYERDLNKLKEELTLYKDEAAIWKIKDGISNSAGNLTLHLIGNLNHFVGMGLGKTNYVRNRDAEFTLKDIPRKELLAEIDKTIGVVKNAIGNLQVAEFEKDFHIQIGGKTMKTDYLLIHLFAHLGYHLGQINYHRRLVA